MVASFLIVTCAGLRIHASVEAANRYDQDRA
jgi:hypothetical protein